jgi:hypothetical protein
MAYTPPTGNDADLIFSGAYTPPAGDAADLIFGAAVAELYQIWSDISYVYAATAEGLDIYDIVTESKDAYITYNGGFSTVWGNDDRVFVGTSTSGVKYFDKTCVSGLGNVTSCLSNLRDLTYYHKLTSDNIKYIHGNDDKVLCVTTAGVDVVKLDPQSYRSYTTTVSGHKGFMTSTGKFYYIASGTQEAIHRVDSSLTDWTTPDKSYWTGSGIFEAGISINDIFITENTADDNLANTIFAATSSGVYVIDESDDSNKIYSTVSGIGDHGILKGAANNFIAIWADADAGLETGRMYVGSPAAFTIVNLAASPTVFDWYTESRAGRAGETLDSDDMADLNAV